MGRQVMHMAARREGTRPHKLAKVELGQPAKLIVQLQSETGETSGAYP